MAARKIGSAKMTLELRQRLAQMAAEARRLVYREKGVSGVGDEVRGDRGGCV